MVIISTPNVKYILFYDNIFTSFTNLFIYNDIPELPMYFWNCNKLVIYKAKTTLYLVQNNDYPLLCRKPFFSKPYHYFGHHTCREHRNPIWNKFTKLQSFIVATKSWTRKDYKSIFLPNHLFCSLPADVRVIGTCFSISTGNK